MIGIYKIMKTYEIIKKKLNGSDTDLAHVIAYCLALKGFSISEEDYNKLPEMFKTYFTDEAQL